MAAGQYHRRAGPGWRRRRSGIPAARLPATAAIWPAASVWPAAIWATAAADGLLRAAATAAWRWQRRRDERLGMGALHPLLRDRLHRRDRLYGPGQEKGRQDARDLDPVHHHLERHPLCD